MATGADYEVIDVSSGEEITNPGANDVMVAFHKSTGALEKIDYNKLAKAIIEQYTGSTLGGSAQSVKTAVDTTWESLSLERELINAARKNVIPNQTDINTLITPGVYSIISDSSAGTMVNLPRNASGKIIVFVKGANVNYLRQIYYTTSATTITYEREYSNGTWSDWAQRPTRAEIDAIKTKIGL